MKIWSKVNAQKCLSKFESFTNFYRLPTKFQLKLLKINLRSTGEKYATFNPQKILVLEICLD